MSSLSIVAPNKTASVLRSSSAGILSCACVVVLVGCSAAVPSPLVDASRTDDAHVDSALDGHVEIDADTSVDSGFADAADGSADGSTSVDASDAATPTDAGPVLESCSTPSATRNVACGRCGVRPEYCGADGVWHDDGPCTGEGPCTPADVEHRTNLNCGVESRTCTAACTWGDYARTVDDQVSPVCQYGESRIWNRTGCSNNTARFEVCTDQCVWPGTGSECGGGCIGAPRTTPADSEEICVPGGPFLRGSASYAHGRPVYDVWMTSFYMDRYPVTYRRYSECVVAGVCTQLNPLPAAAAANPSAIVWEATDPQANAYCGWDGDRALASAAQWEKAASGPSPRDASYIWTVPSDCTLLPRYGCPGVAWFSNGRVFDSFDAFPASQSYYGIEMMGMSFFERTRDFLHLGYPAQPVEMLVDPVNTTPLSAAMEHIMKGGPRQGSVPLLEDNVTDYNSLPAYRTAFRCVRRGQ